MAREVDILSYLPSILHEIKELQKVSEIENPSLEQVWELVESILNNQFILTLDDRGASRYEKMLGLVAGESETLETRRFRILSRYQEQAPYSYPVLKQLLDSLLGEGKYELTRSASEKWVRVKMELTVAREFEIVEVLLERVTPQNMLLYIEIRYNQHITLARFTHAQLAAYTHKQLREEVMS
ncbi:putative phage tail protein [Lysinibacillus sp. M3]|uniref:Phage tail protein n=1 Tax=Lysinibacillus zambalensis TaxID=3160866 RepID=A0ABV1MZE3_9BACI